MCIRDSYESYQIVNENLVAREFINFYQNDSEKYSLTLSAGSKEIVVTEFVYAPYTYISKDEPGYYTYDNTLLELSINGEKITDLEKTIDQNMFIENTYVVVRRGKKNYYIGKAK